MARIKILKDTFINGKPVLAGKEKDVSERTAGLLIGRNMAEKVEENREDKQLAKGKKDEGIEDANS
jgi:hypothetical protein